MRYIDLIPGCRSSVLGFGCAPILGAVDGATAERALGVALDAGITHFDLARSYGYGAAEVFVGKFMKGRRDKLVLATKFGIRASWLARLAAPLKPLVRGLRSCRAPSSIGTSESPKIAHRSRTLGGLLHRSVALTPESMIRSVETSLRALSTDRLDILFLHEPREEISLLNDLHAAASRLKSEGKILGWGLASPLTQLEPHRAHLDHFDVLQIDVPRDSATYQYWQAERSGRPTVFFSPSRGMTATPAAPLAERLAHYWRDFPSAVVLCSMFHPEHIRENVRLAGIDR